MDSEAEDNLLFKSIALACAAMSWSGISAVGNREQSIIKTAKAFEQYLKEDLDD